MAEMLLINPRRRKGGTRKRRATTSRRRRRNPIATIASRKPSPRRVARRRNPIGALRRSARRAIGRRRRNPIAMGGLGKSLFTGVKDALIGAGGAVAVDMAYARIAPFLPASLQRTPGRVGAGDAVKAVITVLLGRLLSKPTRGLSGKMAQGALTVQMHGLVSNMLPAGALGYWSPYALTQGSQRVGPIRGRVGAYTGGPTPLLNAYTRSASPLLSGVRSARSREGAIR